MGPRSIVIGFGATLALLSACSGPSSSSDTPTLTVPLAGGSTLVFEDGGRLAEQRPTIERVVNDTLAAARSRIPLDGITIRVEAGGSLVIPEIGIGGRADAGTIQLALDPGSPVLPRSLDEELFPLLAHEMHHVARLRTAGFPSNLLQAMVLEGLADHFSIEVAGIDPPIWASALTEAELTTWTERARAVWLDGGYDHDAWFFGTAPPIPRWAGYTIGFDLVRDFLRKNPSRLPSDLYAEPAVSFVPE